MAGTYSNHRARVEAQARLAITALAKPAAVSERPASPGTQP
jgi:hypothetical protein